MLSYGDRGAREINGDVMFRASAASPSAGGNDESMNVHEVESNILERLNHNL